ncbi:hypothetical protein L1987_04277 [Smallanthus sonchifolius]|uniref:Uncharacterized protein n=1 Tax=Smallanthus sonchifolius TaxID=185202 RepID=A0ACB9KD34_9ASTR|nr:hypothetical protein L1987_04277 [Smallanthus sonchifolius]
MAVEEINKQKKTRRNPFMAKSDHEREPEDTKESPPATAAAVWGTWEELLLAYAVNRYGTKSWDSISSELRKRSSAPIHLTPHHCEQKYGELKRRFNQSDDNDVNMDDGSDATTTTTAVPWLEELRKLRVLELQRELQNYDLYISSLQLKVKKLTEESEKHGGETKPSDLGHENEEIELETAEEAKNETPEPAVSGEEDSDRDNQSVNGSNGNIDTGVDKSENENEASPVGTGDEKLESAAVLPVREVDSCNGRPEGNEPVKTEPDGDASEAPESIAESKSEGKNSDVQSSASKSRKEKNDRVRRGSSKVDEREIEDQSTDSIPVRSLPLVDFLQKLHKLGSVVFEPRLDRQEKIRYKNLIRQPIDYETVQTRLKEGWYSDGNDKFFRDLLLLVNNTRVFFPKESPESIVAVDLRQFIMKEMISKKKQKTDSKSTDKQTSSKSSNLPPKRATEPADSLLLKPKLTGPIVVCRKRSSITAKAAGSSSGKKEQTDSKNSDKVTEETPKKSRDSFPLLAKKKGKSPVNEASDPKPEKKKKLSEAEEKKQSAAKFLNRMKRSNEPLLNTLKSSSERGGSESDSKGGDQKKSGGNKGGNGGGDAKKDQSGKKSSGGRQVKEQDSPAKRSVGRPPKRAAVLGKRNREPAADSETLDSKQTKKRSKR